MIEIQVTRLDVLGVIEDYVQVHGLNTNFLILKSTEVETPHTAIEKFRECFVDEKIAVAAIAPFHSSGVPDFDLRALKNQVQPIENMQVTCINLRLVIDYASEIRSMFGPLVSLSNIADYLNVYGFSTVQIPIGIMGIFDEDTPEINNFAKKRSSISYLSTIQKSLAYSSENFLTEFVKQIEDSSKKILLDLSGLPRTMNGTSRVSYGLLNEINSQISRQNVEVSVLAIAPQELLEELRVKFTAIQFEYNFPAADVKFDLGFSVTPVTSLKICFEMSLRSAKWIVLQLDLIALRSYAHLSQQPSALEAFRYIQNYADLVINISNFSAKDAENFFQGKPKGESFVSLLGVPDEFLVHDASNFESSERNGKILVLGNDEPHKQVRRVVKKLLELNESVISISKQKALGRKHSVISPGTLSEADLLNLMLNSELIIFPSIYEGFGLPLVEAASIGRPVVCWNTSINKEIINEFELTNIFLLSSLEELRDVIWSLKRRNIPSTVSIPSLSKFNADVVNKMISLLYTEIDVKFAQLRWSAMRLVGSTFEESKRNRQNNLNRQNLNLLEKALRKIGNMLLSLTETKLD